MPSMQLEKKTYAQTWLNYVEQLCPHCLCQIMAFTLVDIGQNIRLKIM